MLFCAVVVASLFLLLPIYLNASTQVKSESDRLMIYKASQTFSDTEESSRVIKETTAKLTTFSLTETPHDFSKIILLLNSITPSGILIKDMSLTTEASEGSHVALLLHGNASTRENLVEFVDALKKDPTFDNVELPVSGLVKERNIDFNLSLKVNYEN